jgi:hypothetical protein
MRLLKPKTQGVGFFSRPCQKRPPIYICSLNIASGSWLRQSTGEPFTRSNDEYDSYMNLQVLDLEILTFFRDRGSP